MTYNSLVQEIEDYLNRYDTLTIANIPNFISQAQQIIARECKNIGFEQVAVGAFTANNAVQAKPGRWRTTLAINFGSGANNNVRNPIEQRSYDYLRLYWQDDSQTAPPEFYADYGYSNWLFAPTPDQAYPYEVTYLELPVPLTVNQQTNWLTIYAPEVLLYGSLLQSMSFLKNDERVPLWQSYYQMGLTALKAENHSRLVDRQSNIQQDKPASNQD